MPRHRIRLITNQFPTSRVRRFQRKCRPVRSNRWRYYRATPAEYGDKTSLVVNAITKSGLGQKKPTGSFNTTYGSFGTISQDASLAYGRGKLGNFVTLNLSVRVASLIHRNLPCCMTVALPALSSIESITVLTLKTRSTLIFFWRENNFQTPNQFDQQAFVRANGSLFTA